MISAEATPVWEEGEQPASGGNSRQSGDTLMSVTSTETDADAVAGSNSETNGPLTAHVEQSGWTTDDVMIALSAANVLMFALLLYLSHAEGGA